MLALHRYTLVAASALGYDAPALAVHRFYAHAGKGGFIYAISATD